MARRALDAMASAADAGCGKRSSRDLALYDRTIRDAAGTIYRETIFAAILELRDGPAVAGSKPLEQIRPGLRVLHIARHRRRGRHRLIYRVSAQNVIEILRILHDAMDAARHIPAADR